MGPEEEFDVSSLIDALNLQRSSTETDRERTIRTVSSETVHDFRLELESVQGKCFRTEVRSTGIFICGVHQDRWDGQENADICPQQKGLLDGLRSILISRLEANLRATPKLGPSKPDHNGQTSKASPDGLSWNSANLLRV